MRNRPKLAGLGNPALQKGMAGMGSLLRPPEADYEGWMPALQMQAANISLTQETL